MGELMSDSRPKIQLPLAFTQDDQGASLGSGASGSVSLAANSVTESPTVGDRLPVPSV